MIYQHQCVLPCRGDGLLKPEVDALNSAVNSEKDALRHHESWPHE